MKTIYSKFLAIIVIAFALTASVNAQVAGDYVSQANGDWNTAYATVFGISDGAGGITGMATVAPTASDNVWIKAGHTVTYATGTAFNCKNLDVAGTLTLSYFGTVWGDFNLQAGAALNNGGGNFIVRGNSTVSGLLTLASNIATTDLTINAGGQVKSLTVAQGSVQALYLNGANLIVNGTLGANAGSSVGTLGEGIRLYCNYTGETNISGTGAINIARFNVGGAYTTAAAANSSAQNTGNQTINIGVDMQVRNYNSTATGGFSMQNGNEGTGVKVANILAEKTVSINGLNNKAFFHYTSSTAGTTYTCGNISYNVYGTLDCSVASINLSTTSGTGNQTVALNVMTGGTLKIGSAIGAYSNYSATGNTSTIAPGIFANEGSTIVFAGATAPVFTFGAVSGGTMPTFPTAFYNLVNSNTSVAGVTLAGTNTVSNVLLNMGVLTGDITCSKRINVSSADVAKGSVTGSLSGSVVTLTATPVATYVFAKWTEGATQISTSNPYVFTPTASQTLVANFDVDPSTGLNNAVNNAFVSVDGRNLKLSADVLSAELYNGVGQLISRQINNSTVSVNNSGIFIVKMNTLQGVKVQKVIVK